MPPPIDHRSGYCPSTKTFHSLRPPTPLPPPTLPISFPTHAFSLLPSPLPSHPALLDTVTGEAISFPAFLSRVGALAAALRADLGVSCGDVALVLAPNSLDIPVLYFALLSIGAVVSPANSALTTAEVSRLVALSSPSVAFATSSTTTKIPSGLPTVLLDSPQFHSFLKRHITLTPDTCGVDQSDPAAILYSSGTTGHAKAAVLTHRNLIAAATTPVATAAAAAAAVPQVLMLTVPMFHVYGFVFCLRTVPAAETLVVHTAARFNAREVLGAVESFRVARLVLAPPALLSIVRVVEEDNGAVAGASSLQAVNCGGAPLAATLVRRFSDKFPHTWVSQGYGLTESTAGFSRAAGAEESRRIGSSGRLSYGAEVKIVDPTSGVALPPGMPGELWVRGPFIMQGYLGDKESTLEILNSEGWLKTGDLCYIDNDGFLFVVDRLKELIKYKGYQVTPAELEHRLQTHPDITEAAVVPYPDNQAGELPVAFVVRHPASNLDEAQIKEFVAKQVASYKRIHHVFLVDSLPKNAGGKVLRKDLVKLASQINSKL